MDDDLYELRRADVPRRYFLIMWAILAFVFGHLVMVVLHGWNNLVSMLTGWKKDPEYLSK